MHVHSRTLQDSLHSQLHVPLVLLENRSDVLEYLRSEQVYSTVDDVTHKSAGLLHIVQDLEDTIKHTWPRSTEAVLSRWGVFITIAKNTLYGQNYRFYFMPKIIRILRSCSMKIFNTVNILKLNFGLVMHCYALNLNNFKDDFLNI